MTFEQISVPLNVQVQRSETELKNYNATSDVNLHAGSLLKRKDNRSFQNSIYFSYPFSSLKSFLSKSYH